MLDSRSITARVGCAFAIIATALLAAALGHLAIDALGDIVLSHDTYDDVAHDSRTVAAAAAGATLLAAAARAIYDALCAAFGRRAACRAFVIASPPRFLLTVVLLAVPLVLEMEAIDAAVAHRAIADVADLFGGSIALGLGTTVGVAIVVAAFAVGVLRFFCTTRRLIIGAFRGLFQLRDRRSSHAFTAIGRRRVPFSAVLVERRLTAKRGPPLRIRDRPL